MKRKPNLIIIVMDCARADRFSCYGYSRRTTPNIDRIAEESTLFENAFTSGIWTLPSHVSLFTGMYESKHGVHSFGTKLDESFVTLAELLKKQGYRTIGISHNGFVSHATGLSRGFDHFEELWMSGKKPICEKIPYIAEKLYEKLFDKCDSGAKMINRTIRKLLSKLDITEMPFFLFINYMEPHARYWPPKPYRELFFTKRSDVQKAKHVNQWTAKYLVDKDSMNQQDFHLLNCLYDGEIAYLDSKIGELYNFLKDTNVLDNSLLVITSDHGENIGDHELLGHQYCLYDTLMHVPLIVRFPDVFPKAKRVNDLVQALDIFATVLEILGIEDERAKDQNQGHSLLPDKIEKTPRNFVIGEYLCPQLGVITRMYPNFDASRFNRTLRAIRTKGFKYIWASDGNCELYDLVNDPKESNNIIFQRRDVADKLQGLLQQWLSSFKHYSGEVEEHKFDEETRKRLQSLGYI